MKRLFAVLLAVLMCMSIFSGCQKKDVWEQTVISLGEQTNACKTYGRTTLTETGPEIAWPASGVEFTLKCSGTVQLNYSSAIDCFLQICVDGEETARTKCRSGLKSVTLAENLTEGEHTFRVLLDSDINLRGGSITFQELEFYGVKASVKPTAQKELLIEFVGDSITSGIGVLPQDGNCDGVAECHSAAHAYAVHTAEALNADWSLVSRSSSGYFRVTVCPYTANEFYPYLNRFVSEPEEYTFPRKADIAVLALGTNDGYELASGEKMKAAMRQLIGQVRSGHGEDTPVILLYGMMTSRWEKQYQEVAEELEGVWTLKVPQNNDGCKDHPTEEAMIVTAEKLTAFIQENILPTLQK